jgi:adenosylcobinamide-GDP ribazoletransferase
VTTLRPLGDGLRLAVGTLTIVPVGRLRPVTPSVARWAMLLAPVAALPLGMGTVVVAGAGRLAQLPGLVTAGLVLALLGWGTRAMHWDGLADTADGLAASWDRERALDIMRRGDAGPVAVGVLGTLLLVDAAALAALVDRPRGVWVAAVAVVTARVACALTGSTLLRAARADGLGVGVARSVPPAGSLAALGGVAVLVSALGTLAAVPWWRSALAVAAAVAAVVLLLWRCTRSLGGVTGDVMGACIELAQCVLLVVLCSGTSA